MRILPFLPGTFIFQTALRPQDIEFIVLDKMPEPGFLPASRPYSSYFGEANEECFIIRGISQKNRPPRPVAQGRMDQNRQGGTLVTVEFGFAWRQKLIFGIIGFVVTKMIYSLTIQTAPDLRYIFLQVFSMLFGLVMVIYFLHRFRADCTEMKSMMLDLFNGQPLKE